MSTSLNYKTCTQNSSNTQFLPFLLSRLSSFRVLTYTLIFSLFLFPSCKNDADMAKKKQTPVVEKTDTVPIPQNTEGSLQQKKEKETVKKEPTPPPKSSAKPVKEKATESKPPQTGSLERRMDDYINSRKPVDDTIKH